MQGNRSAAPATHVELAKWLLGSQSSVPPGSVTGAWPEQRKAVPSLVVGKVVV